MILLISSLLPCSSPSSTWLLLSNSLEVSWEASYTLASKLLSLSFYLINPLFSSANFACRSNYFSLANLSSSMSCFILPGYAVSSPSLISSLPCSFYYRFSILNSFSKSLFYVWVSLIFSYNAKILSASDTFVFLLTDLSSFFAFSNLSDALLISLCLSAIY